MKTKKQILSVLALLALSGSLTLADLLGTAFTYQGQLTVGGLPANGSYDLKFTLYTNAIGGNALDKPLTNSPVRVAITVFSGDGQFKEGQAMTLPAVMAKVNRPLASALLSGPRTL